MIVQIQNINFLRPVFVPKRVAPLSMNNGTDSVSLSFTGLRGLDLEPAAHYSGIHCPSCGIRMLSEEEHEHLLQRADQIENTRDLVLLLKDYRKFIPNNMRDILNNTATKKEYEDLTIREYYTQHRDAAYEKIKKRISMAAQYLRNYADKYDDDKKKIILESADFIDSTIKYKDIRERITALGTALELNNIDMYELKKNTLKNIATSNNYFKIFHIKDYKTISDKELAKELVAHIFKHTVSKITPIENYEKYLNSPNNTILTCENCLHNATEHVFWKSSTNPMLKDNIRIYLQDIAILMGQGKLDNISGYINNVAFLTKILSHGLVSFEEKELNKILNLKLIASRHDEFEPIIQSRFDVPCAQCGSVLLPHEIHHDDIGEELINCCNPYEYNEVVKKYKKYVGSYGKQSINDFQELVKNNPTITNEECIKLIRAKADSRGKSEIRNAMNKFAQARAFYAKNRPFREIEFIDKVDKLVMSYINKGNFDDFNFVNFITYCNNAMDLNEVPLKSVHVLFEDLKRACYKNGLTKVPKTAIWEDQDEVYTFLFNVFKSAEGTADHLEAFSQGGNKSVDNLIGLCRGCNRLKKDNHVSVWYINNFNVRLNLPRQISVINRMYRMGLLNDKYANWGEGINNTMQTLTEGRYKINPDSTPKS